MKVFKQTITLILLGILLFNTTCEDDDPIFVTDCDFVTVVNNNLYNNVENDAFFSIEGFIINGSCLELAISSSGCDGESWEYTLIDSGDIAESDPVQRSLKLSFVNNEACLAVFTRIVSFDISNLQVQDGNAVLLNIDGLNDAVLYEY